MPENIKLVFAKISEQLEDKTHPIIRIISSFQREFIKDTKELYKALEPELLKKTGMVQLLIEGEDDKYAINHERLTIKSEANRRDFESPIPIDSSVTTSRSMKDQTNPLSRKDLLIFDSSDNNSDEVDEKLAEFAEEQIQQVKIFLQIMFGSIVRFYSTVIDWDYIQSMREDLIERLTSKIFDNADFSCLMLQLSCETVRGKQKKYWAAVEKAKKLKPKDVGINLYFTCDETSKLEQVFRELHPEHSLLGDSGSSSSSSLTHNGSLTVIVEEPEEEKRESVHISRSNRRFTR